MIEVLPVKKSECYEWCLKKHYAHRIPGIITAQFGLYVDDMLSGICLFGISSNKNAGSAFSNIDTLELVRLVVDDSLKRNTLSQFVSRSLSLLCKPIAVVSYADPSSGHHGYIYQATNWIYTGESSPSTVYVKNGIEYHSRTISDVLGSRSREVVTSAGYGIVIKPPKHRYYYLLGSKGQRKKMLSMLKKKYTILPYPKGDNTRYDASHQPKVQMKLF